MFDLKYWRYRKAEDMSEEQIYLEQDLTQRPSHKVAIYFGIWPLSWTIYHVQILFVFLTNPVRFTGLVKFAHFSV